MVKRKICIFTGSRADYGLLRPLIAQLNESKLIKLQILVSGMHLSHEFGLTCNEIENDYFVIDEKVDIELGSDTAVGICKSMGLGLIRFAEAYERLKPDIVVILGDRFEAFSAAVSAMIARIPIAHLHGGEATLGLIDENLRHCITKMSHLHFTATEEYRNKVIQLGEEPARVFNTGAIGLDGIKSLKLLSKKRLEKELNFTFNKHNLLITYHPVTLERNTSKKDFQQLLIALEDLRDTNFIFTKSNADTGGRVINNLINSFVEKKSHISKAFASLGRLKYLSTMQFVDAIVGNSSSGIIEAPSFKIGTVNIGNRQEGRIKAKNVIDCRPIKNEIVGAIKQAFSKDFQDLLINVVNPYEKKGTAKMIRKVLETYNLNNLIKKRFFSINLYNDGISKQSFGPPGRYKNYGRDSRKKG